MSDLAIITSAFLLGLFGSVHCAAMCGGLAGYLETSHKMTGSRSGIKPSLSFHIGRFGSYARVGVIASIFGQTLLDLTGKHAAHTLMQMLAGGFLIIVGLNLTGWWNGLGVVEKAGQKFWHLLSPLTRHIYPVTNYPRAIAAGALWGWLPCGLVYSAALLAVATSHVLVGAAAMVAFGFGTTPALLAIAFGGRIIALKSNPRVRHFAGGALVLFGSGFFTGVSITGMHSMFMDKHANADGTAIVSFLTEETGQGFLVQQEEVYRCGY